ncbi:MAG: hypothetical protein COB67_11910 [SAR324 cluster bacterium]|uniref:Uncharacterized protein n=1 Tax=SAR324 cluster bacterium TaxID=2024889 RepID=A0A2A4SSM8_9DELT|nr:MAG: hypothetical protein COB67_11910 [SAR324 cluster bacterium]
MSKSIISRQEERYSHIYIRLKVYIDEEWHWIKVYDWNTNGFNFFSKKNLSADQIYRFKKGITTFTGRIAWQRQHADEKSLIEMAINYFLFERLCREFSDQEPDWIPELANLVRQPDKVQEKIDFMDQRMGSKIPIEKIKKIIQESNWKQGGQFGIQTNNSSWEKVAKEAFERSTPLREFVATNVQRWGLF